MRTLPYSMQTKLAEQFKGDANGNVPKIHLIATQTSMNTLLSEPIVEDIDPAFGDVAIRQMQGEDSLSLAYAISIDEDGNAKIYQREMPALFDEKWQWLWTLGTASDVAIEFDGTWTLDPTMEWYYLETESLPYIFWVDSSGNLYVQKWRGEATQIATGVSQIATVKGWKSSINPTDDQGLIVAYLKSGAVYYRAYCTQADSTKAWEAEHQVTELSTGNTTLALVRTNDFRIGFLTQNGDDIKLSLSKRTYAGMSVKPETVHVAASAAFSFEARREFFGYTSDTAAVTVNQPFFLYEDANGASEITVSSAEKIHGEGFTATGCKVHLSKPLSGTVDAVFKANTKANNTVVSDVTFEEDTLVITFASALGRQIDITVSIPSTRYLTYDRVQGQRWFLPALTVTLAAETQSIYGYEEETVGVSTTGGFEYEAVSRKYGNTDEAVTVSVNTAGMTLEAVGVLPI